MSLPSPTIDAAQRYGLSGGPDAMGRRAAEAAARWTGREERRFPPSKEPDRAGMSLLALRVERSSEPKGGPPPRRARARRFRTESR